MTVMRFTALRSGLTMQTTGIIHSLINTKGVWWALRIRAPPSQDTREISPDCKKVTTNAPCSQSTLWRVTAPTTYRRLVHRRYGINTECRITNMISVRQYRPGVSSTVRDPWCQSAKINTIKLCNILDQSAWLKNQKAILRAPLSAAIARVMKSSRMGQTRKPRAPSHSKSST